MEDGYHGLFEHMSQYLRSGNDKNYNNSGLLSAECQYMTGIHCTDLLLLQFKFNLLKTKRRPLYLKTHPVPRCKHFSSRL
jgi:hypothetical protein